MITECRPVFRQTHPRSRAKAFAWYLEQGTLVTFYRYSVLADSLDRKR